jgi:hypothetical protein
MLPFVFDYRQSDSPLVEMVWHTHSVGGGSFTSSAAVNWEMVITRWQGKTTITMRGPETKASQAPIPDDAEFFGIVFKLGTFMPHLPVNELVNSGITLPESVGASFTLHGSSWQMPTFDNADTFVQRLVRSGLLVRDPVVESVLQGRTPDFSVRSVQRRFLRSTGLTYNAIRQIERANHALNLLQRGVSILDAVHEAGYADQPHLTRSLKLLMGRTPAQIIAASKYAFAAR